MKKILFVVFVMIIATTQTGCEQPKQSNTNIKPKEEKAFHVESYYRELVSEIDSIPLNDTLIAERGNYQWWSNHKDPVFIPRAITGFFSEGKTKCDPSNFSGELNLSNNFIKAEKNGNYHILVIAKNGVIIHKYNYLQEGSYSEWDINHADDILNIVEDGRLRPLMCGDHLSNKVESYYEEKQDFLDLKRFNNFVIIGKYSYDYDYEAYIIYLMNIKNGLISTIKTKDEVIAKTLYDENRGMILKTN